ncbi:undecaprenyl diphosphate synthase family protein [Amycolatopsis sp. cmx-4-83]|uniref:undecaprenyl diphosphate synthase family protein n=1 Tax=Amycolatopsis sp. cmx-4-83 TaxID=2790940 RepID=UPI00397B8847
MTVAQWLVRLYPERSGTAGARIWRQTSARAAPGRGRTCSRDCPTGAHVTPAIGYGGRQEIVDGLRDLLIERATSGSTLAEVAETLTVDDVAAHLYTPEHPEPDLIIRTSGEQCLSNFLLWQGAYAELQFCDAYWPAFREIDFLRALHGYAGRECRR